MIQGNIASVTEPNGVVTTYTYNSLNRLTDEVVKNAGGAALAERNVDFFGGLVFLDVQRGAPILGS